ncbi:MAG: AmmeMemoRadiSam system protein B [Candidatus Thorarchaeota archaeon]|nr:MAG: AmmeMemoRadiSam system protein B [Candidatus Thorarchaeota archaeon]
MTRMPVVAGRFYEGKEDLLRKRIENCFLGELGPGQLPEGNPGTNRNLKAVIAPHAGYMYSGMPAAHTYLNLFEDGKPDHIVILGPNHTGMGARLAVCNEDWETPLGKARFDSGLGAAIVQENKYASNDCIAHSNEHSIEVQVPFLQYIFGPDVNFIPICVTDQSYSVCESIGMTLAKLAENEDILVIASSDFTHFTSAQDAKIKDNQAMEYLEMLDPEGFLKFVQGHRLSICGAGPIAATLVFAKERGANYFNLLKYSTSGDVSGDNNSVVAYVSATCT